MGNVPTKDVSATSSGSSSRSRSGSTATNDSTVGRRSSRAIGAVSSREYSSSSIRSGKKKISGLSDRSGSTLVISDGTEMVDGGYLAPQGVYSGPQDFKVKVVRNLMIERRLAPFYKGLEDYEDDWTDRQLLAAVRGLPIPEKEKEEEEEEDAEVGEKEREVGSKVESERSSEAIEDDDGEDLSGRAILGQQDSDTKWISSSLPNQTTNGFLERNSDDGGAFSNNSNVSNQSIHSSNSITEEQKQILTPLSSTEDQEIPFPSTVSSPVENSAIKILEFKTETLHLEGERINRGTTETTGEIKTSPTSPAPPITNNTNRPRQGSAKLGPPIMFPRSRANTTSKFTSAPINQSKPPSPPMEILLYRGSVECPICFLNYPKYINTTRCCNQPICSECFVQIKRAEPHAPYHAENSSTPSTPPPSDTPEEALVTEPACCPFCQMSDFGVVYVPSPYRSGIPVSSLTSSLRAHLSSSLSNVFSSHHHTPVSSSAASIVSMSTTNSATDTPRRRGSLPPNAPEVITTDQIRPDWAMKLSRARHQLARKSAAANALHASAFLFETDSSSQSSSSHSRRHHEKKKKSSSRLRGFSSPSSPSSYLGSSSSSNTATASTTSTSTTTTTSSGRRHTTSSPAPSFPIPSRSRIRDLEDMMIVEAIRRSLTDDGAPPAESSKTPASQSSKEVKKDEITTQ